MDYNSVLNTIGFCIWHTDHITWLVENNTRNGIPN